MDFCVLFFEYFCLGLHVLVEDEYHIFNRGNVCVLVLLHSRYPTVESLSTSPFNLPFLPFPPTSPSFSSLIPLVLFVIALFEILQL